MGRRQLKGGRQEGVVMMLVLVLIVIVVGRLSVITAAAFFR